MVVPLQLLFPLTHFFPGLVSYDDERAICDKTGYAIDNNLNGYIIWELSGDLMPDLSTPLLDATNAKLLNPGLDCASELNDVIFEISGVIPGAPITIWYPAYAEGGCLSDGKESEWLSQSELFDSEEVSFLYCCDHARILFSLFAYNPFMSLLCCFLCFDSKGVLRETF